MYKETAATTWKGRTDHLSDSRYFRYHQMMQLGLNATIGFIGFQCDEGVRRNNGRVGAKEAPIALRQQLASIAWRAQDDRTISDFGDVICEDTDLEGAQQQLGDAVEGILKTGKAVILGGGHETLYGHYLGVRQAVGPDATIGMINIDAHFDMRSYEQQPSSGTMFKQILDQDQHANYFVAGIQQYGNTTALFETADDYGVTYFLDDELQDDSFKPALSQFIEKNDVILVTLCMDVLNAAEAPGVSAPSPFGLQATAVRDILRYVMPHPNVTSFSICEVNPARDFQQQTAKLGAYFVNEVIMNYVD